MIVISEIFLPLQCKSERITLALNHAFSTPFLPFVWRYGSFSIPLSIEKVFFKNYIITIDKKEKT